VVAASGLTRPRDRGGEFGDSLICKLSNLNVKLQNTMRVWRFRKTLKKEKVFTPPLMGEGKGGSGKSLNKYNVLFSLPPGEG
jgi:hypothetical protein